MIFSFQNDSVQSFFNITRDVNTSLDHRKLLSVGQLKLLSWSYILEWISLGVPIKYFIMV